MLSYYIGLWTAPKRHSPSSLTGLSWRTFRSNWNPQYGKDASFSSVASVFFPCFTGILSGADRAKDLRRPEKSIPTGTLGAIIISFVMYLSYMGFWGAVGTREYLLTQKVQATGNPVVHGHAQLAAVRDIAFPLPILTELGIIVACFSQTLQCIITAPRLLQAIAADGIIPFLDPFAKESKSGEPHIALVFTTVLCMIAAMIGSLDQIAPLVSICFLTCYSALNLSCFVLSIVKAPSWRPRWMYYHWSSALLGSVLCLAMNFVLLWYWALAAVCIVMVIYGYIQYRQVEVDWGTGVGGLLLQLAAESLSAVRQEAQYSINWRPQLLCLSKPKSMWTKDGHAGHQFLSFASQLKKGQGLCVVTAILEGRIEETRAQVAAEKVHLENCMVEAKVTGFARILVAPTYREGKMYAIQSSGLGALEPNTVLLGWPTKWHEEEHKDHAMILLETLKECKAAERAVLLCMHLSQFPAAGDPQEGYIDVWWIVHDGGLLLILAHLIRQHRVWRKCRLRVHTVAEKSDDSMAVKKNLEKLLEKVHIVAEVEVLELEDSDLAPYTFDNTIRMEEALAFAEKISKYRRTQESRGSASRPTEIDKEALLKTISEHGNNRSLPEVFRNTFPSELSMLRGVISASRRTELMQFKGPGSEASLARGTEASTQNASMPGLPYYQSKTESSTKAAKTAKSPAHFEEEKNKVLHAAETRSDIAQKSQESHLKSDARHEDYELPSSHAASDNEALCAKEPLFVTECGIQLPDNRQDIEITVEDQPQIIGKDLDAPPEIVSFGEEEQKFKLTGEKMNLDGSAGSLQIGEIKGSNLTRKGSAGQLYPGSPHSLASGLSALELPDTLIRSWETFSQSYSPKKLNDLIFEQSKNAQLVLLNLPDHYHGVEPARYMEYCEELTKGLRRVLLVRGTGKELWTANSQI
ncbi:hypothetical protein O6H91_22G059400 [Diphasiastrum complanatum]|nr:hypothetical protein O6H91_22G059400 [Diphasiastrum complanatum]